MADVYPTLAGAWSTRIWNNAATGLAYTGVTPQAGDTVFANGLAITVDQDITVAGIRTTAQGSAVANGSFTVSTTRTLTINSTITAGSSTCLIFSGGSGITLTLTGAALTITGSSTTNTRYGLSVTGIGTVNFTGNAVGGASDSSGVSISAGATYNQTGNATGGTGRTAHGVEISSAAATVTITGSVTGGGGANDSNYGVSNGTATAVSIIGNVTGGSINTCYGVHNNSTGVVTITGNVTGGTHQTAYGAYNSSTGQLLISGSVTAATAPAISDNVNSAGFIRVGGPIVNTGGINAITAAHISVVAECDWTIAKAGTPPAYNGTITIGLKSSGGSFPFIG